MKHFILPLGLVVLPATALAQTPTATTPDEYVNVCESAPYTDFDFWVGDWVAFDYDTGVVQGIDRIEKIADGCAIHQDWTQLTDRYRTPGAPERYFGNSITAPINPPNGGWQQVWVNQGGGGAITLRGGLNDDGVMEIATDEIEVPDGRIFRQVWFWRPLEGGRIHSWGEVQIRQQDEAEYSDIQIPWNLMYVLRADAPNLVAQPAEADSEG